MSLPYLAELDELAICEASENGQLEVVKYLVDMVRI